MPTAEEHLETISRNGVTVRILAEAAQKRLPPADVSDWVVTIQYYILCLYIQAYGESQGKTFARHLDMRDWINSRESGLAEISRAYRKAEEWSRDARYKGRRFRKDEIDRFTDWFLQVRNFVASLLRQKLTSRVPEIAPLDYDPE